MDAPTRHTSPQIHLYFALPRLISLGLSMGFLGRLGTFSSIPHSWTPLDRTLHFPPPPTSAGTCQTQAWLRVRVRHRDETRLPWVARAALSHQPGSGRVLLDGGVRTSRQPGASTSVSGGTGLRVRLGLHHSPTYSLQKHRPLQ